MKEVVRILEDDYFSIFDNEYDDLRPDDYYQKAAIYNQIIDRIVELNGIDNLQSLLPVRTIYSNINALKIDYVRSLTGLYDDRGFVDWRLAPDGSVIAIDEVQLVEPFKQVKNKEEPIIQNLTVHRHRGFDIYFITQSANLLHVQLKDLIGLHWHITVPWGWVSKVYQYGSYSQNPNAVSIKMSAEKKFSFSPPDRIFKLYKSTTINTHQKRIPYKAIVTILSVIIIAISIFSFAVSSGKDSTLIKGMTGQDTKSALVLPEQSSDLKSDKTIDQKSKDEPFINTERIVGSSSSSGVYDPLTGGYIVDPNLAPVSAVSFDGNCRAYTPMPI
jgi:hypothetical protein